MAKSGAVVSNINNVFSDLNKIDVEMDGETKWTNFKCKIPKNKFKNGFCVPSQDFTSEHNMKWHLKIYPNGRNKEEDGYCMVFLHLSSKPKGYGAVYVYYTLRCDQTDAAHQKIKKYDEPRGWGWNKGVQTSLEMTELDEISFSGKIRILRIEYSSGSAPYEYPLDISSLKEKETFRWMIVRDELAKMKSASFGKLFCPNDVLSDNGLYSLHLYPNGYGGSSESTKGKVVLGLNICALPKRVPSMELKVEVEVLEMKKSGTAEFNYDQPSWGATLCDKEQLESLKTMTIVANVEWTDKRKQSESQNVMLKEKETELKQLRQVLRAMKEKEEERKQKEDEKKFGDGAEKQMNIEVDDCLGRQAKPNNVLKGGVADYYESTKSNNYIALKVVGDKPVIPSSVVIRNSNGRDAIRRIQIMGCNQKDGTHQQIEWTEIQTIGDIDDDSDSYQSFPLNRELSHNTDPNSEMLHSHFKLVILENHGSERNNYKFYEFFMFQKYERYHMTKLLGKGTFAKVFKGQDTLNGDKIYAVKVVDLNEMELEDSDAKKRELAMKEVQILRLLHHSNIIKFHEDYGTMLQIHIVLEFCDGGDLAKYIRVRSQRGHGIAEKRAKRFSRQIASALLYLHRLSQPVVHRDLKPGNILLKTKKGSSKWDVKITDFGVSAIKKSIGKTQLGTYTGTSGYQAPEVLERDPTIVKKGPKYGSKADLWSFGMIICKMIKGKHPFFPLTNYREQCKAKLDLDKLMVDNDDKTLVDNDSKALIMSLLQFNPDDRTWDVLKNNKWLQK